MIHTMDVHIATKFGVDIAVIMDFFIRNNYFNKQNPNEIIWKEFDESSLYEYFPYFSPKKIKSIFKKCLSLNLLISHPDKDLCYALPKSKDEAFIPRGSL